jgi:phospholipase C
MSRPRPARTLFPCALLAALLGAPARAGEVPSCPFDAGALPSETLPAGSPHGDAIPIDHIVVLMQENRSFDHYFGKLRPRGERAAEGPPEDASNPDPTGGAPIAPFHKKATCDVADVSHSWNASHAQYDGGAMDGFTSTNAVDADPSGSRAMGYYTARELPFYFDLYRTFAIGDRYFASLLGPTYPNRQYLLAATSFGHIRNDFDFSGAPKTIFEALDEAGVSWRIYYEFVSFAGFFKYVRSHPENLVPASQFAADAAGGTLPSVAFVDPQFFGGPNEENDEHPPANVQVGQAWVADKVRALMKSPLWPRSALFLTYDEHGGYYDHVPPPPACIPDDVPPMLEKGDADAQFDRYGFRVPIVVVSPWARKRFVSHVVHDHTSILRFIETRFDMPALTRRDANADPMLEFFDFASPPFPKPPALRKAKVNAKQAALCDALAAAASAAP